MWRLAIILVVNVWRASSETEASNCCYAINTNIYDQTAHLLTRKLRDSSISTEIYDQTIHLLAWTPRDSSISIEVYDQTVQLLARKPQDSSISTEIYDQTVQLLAWHEIHQLVLRFATKLSTFWPENHETHQLVLSLQPNSLSNCSAFAPEITRLIN